MCKLIDLFIPEWLALSFFLMPSESHMEYSEYLTGNHAGITLITLLMNSLSLYSRILGNDLRLADKLFKCI